MVDMIKLATDLADMQEYEALPPGPYPAELRDIEERFDKNNEPFFYMSFRIDPADYPADYDVGNAPEGLNVVYARLRPADPNDRRTVKPFKEFLKAIGEATKGTAFNPQDWIGRGVTVHLSKTEYQGSPTNQVEKISERATV